MSNISAQYKNDEVYEKPSVCPEPEMCSETDAMTDSGEWIMVFDTETTGLGPNYNNELSTDLARGLKWDTELANWTASGTYIAQLSYIMYNIVSNKYRIYNKFISDIPAQTKERLLESVPQYLREIRAVLKNSVGERGSLDAELHDQLSRYKKEYDGYNRENRNSNTHPITWATLQKEETSKEEDKSDILSVMRQFSSDVNIASKVAAHNANFDRKLIFFEAARIKSADPGSTIFDTLKNNSEKFYCTLCVTKNIVRINSTITKSGTGEFKRTVYRFGIKPPALWEVYDSMFGYPPLEEALHDALADVVVCLRVFYRLWMSGIRDSDCVKNPPPALCGKGPPDIYGKDVTENGDKPGAITKLINDITPKDETGRPIYPEGNFTKDELRQCFNNTALYQTLPSDVPLVPRFGGKRKTVRTRRTKNRKLSRSTGRRSKNTNKRRKK